MMKKMKIKMLSKQRPAANNFVDVKTTTEREIAG